MVERDGSIESRSPPRLIFANQLRGVAALCVVLSHLIGVYWGMANFVGQATASPIQSGPVPGLFFLVSFTWFNFAPLGVGLFFLISGLVIPFSLERHSRASFLAARLLRIFPTYLAALCLELAVLQASALYWHRPMPYSGRAILANMLLLDSVSGQPSIDLVNWTLIIELKFYLIMMCAAPLVRRGSMGLLFGLAGGLVAANLALKLPPLAGLAARHAGTALAMSMDATCLVFMLAGVLFNYHVRGLIRARGLAIGLGAMLLLFLACWRLSGNAAQFPEVTVNYLYSFAIFGLAYLGRSWARPVALLDFFAGISFPLYLVHSLIGFSIIKLLMLSWHASFGVALAVALVLVVGLASLLHRTIEAGSIRLGHRCAPRPRRRGPAVAARVAAHPG